MPHFTWKIMHMHISEAIPRILKLSRDFRATSGTSLIIQNDNYNNFPYIYLTANIEKITVLTNY